MAGSRRRKDRSVSRTERKLIRDERAASAQRPHVPGPRLDPIEEAAYQLPPEPAGLVRRTRLERLLDEGVRGPLTLVSAPAGTGKTVLVSSWAARGHRTSTVVWVSLTHPLVDPAAFWHLVGTGLERHDVDLPEAVSSESHAGEPSFTSSITDGILSHRRPVVLVLDCDGVLGGDVAGRLDSLIQRSGGRLRVVLLTREDPLLPLHRYRLAAALTEVRMTDLAFTRDEAGELLTRMGVDLSEPAMDAMIWRTQGWAAGLRMAAMSLAHREDREEAARKIAGDTGTVAEYLMAEVLDTQPAGVRQLLLDTSVVDVLRPGLAAALAGPQADRALSFLVHGNAFIEEVRDIPGCYRYHHLFRDLLRAQLAYESPARSVHLHRVAGAWLAAHNQVGDAARHAILNGDWEVAAGYVVDDLSVVALLTGRPTDVLHETLAKIPRATEGTAVSIVHAARALAAGDRKGAAAGIQRTLDLLAEPDAESWPAAELATAVVALVHGRQNGDANAAVASAGAALALVPVQEPSRLVAHPEIDAVIQSNLGAALVLSGRLGAAAEAFAAAVAVPNVPGRERPHIDALGHSALLAAWRGDLRRSVDLAVAAVRLSSAAGLTPVGCPSAAEAALAYVDTERYDLAGARQHADRAARCALVPHDPLPTAMLALARARICRAGGDLEGARAVLEGAGHGLPGWLADHLVLERVDILVADGRQARADDLSEQLSEPDSLRAGLERADNTSAAATETELTTMSTHHHVASLSARVSALVRSASQHLRTGDEQRAVRDLDHALRLAAPELSKRVFREAPDELWRLMRKHDSLWSRHAWLTYSRPGPSGDRVPLQRGAVHASGAAEAGRIYEPLTDKEREVLGHLSELLTTEEIAAVMFISVNTVRTHVRNILRKLAASRRNEAVRRARDLKLILS
jgi:LuxR family maltose regulon positive regulatory protein